MDLVDDVLAGDRRALGKAITLVESARPDHRARAVELLEAVLPHTGGAVRLGISGAPGVGKSTFIDVFGCHVVDAGTSVAVLAVDPSSERSGGSILGDKTRMEELARRPEAFIRPSPSGRTIGGVARRTREAMMLCEAAGYGAVIVETVGVGQSETAVADMVDLFCLLVSPGGGDELQGIKRGVMELAELAVVTKADGELSSAADRAAADLRQALHLMRPLHAGWAPRVLLASAVEGSGLGEVWESVLEHRSALQTDGNLDRLRAEQLRRWLWSELREGLVERFTDEAGAELRQAELDVVAGRALPTVAAARLLDSRAPGRL
jgi:LAO/AO transport system kinase